MSYSRGLPLMVIVEKGLKSEGLLERGYDWYVQWVNLEEGVLHSHEFNGVLASWKEKVIQHTKNIDPVKAPSELTVSELIGGLKPVQLWSVLASIATLVGGAFALGGKIFGS